jgi:SAM-dependent methyltransferase
MRLVIVDQQRQPAYLEPYARAAKRHGPDFRALLWASRRTQEQRFDALLRLANARGLSVLDLGCGCGDLLDFLIARDAAPSRYVGIEGVAELAEVAERRHRLANSTILRVDFVAEPWRLRDVDADVIYSSGALNTIDAADFHAAIRNAFAAAKRVFAFNFLSSPLLAGEKYLRWHNRGDVLCFARSLTRDVDVLEDYIEGDCSIAMHKRRKARDAS